MPKEYSVSKLGRTTCLMSAVGKVGTLNKEFIGAPQPLARLKIRELFAGHVHRHKRVEVDAASQAMDRASCSLTVLCACATSERAGQTRGSKSKMMSYSCSCCSPVEVTFARNASMLSNSLPRRVTMHFR